MKQRRQRTLNPKTPKQRPPACEPGNPGRPRGFRVTTSIEGIPVTPRGDAGRIIINPKNAASGSRKAGGTIIINPKGFSGSKSAVHGRILNCIPSRNVETDWQYEHAASAGILRAAAAPPKKFDLREPWWAINDQGQTGSCVGWATADSVIRWHMSKSGRLAQSDLLSSRFLWMSAKETDEFMTFPSTFVEVEGTSLKAALDIARKFGNLVENDLPFNGTLWQGEPEDLYSRAAQRKIASYYNLGCNLQTWKNWLSKNGPILTRLDVDTAWLNVGADGALKKYDAANTYGGHAVALVGYTEATIIVRNSWGTSWGDGGFAHAANAYALAAFTESYGVAL